MARDLLARIEALLAALEGDESHHGGLLGRETLRRASELRLALSTIRPQFEVAEDLTRRNSEQSRNALRCEPPSHLLTHEQEQATFPPQRRCQSDSA